MAFHTYKIEVFSKDTDGTYKTTGTEIDELLSLNVNLALGESADAFNFSFVNYNNVADLFKIDDRVVIYGSLDGTNFVLLMNGVINSKNNTGSVSNNIIAISGLNLLEKMFNSLVSTTGETIQRKASYWIQNIIQQVNEFNNLGYTDRKIYYTETAGTTDPNDPLGRVYTDATLTQTSTNISFTRDLEKAFVLIEELSQDEFTNAGQYYYYLDEYNYFHWKRKPQTIESNLDSGEEILTFRSQKGMYDVVNYIIMNCGKSPYGTSILNFDYQVESINKLGWKTKLITKESIAGDLRQAERKNKEKWDDGEEFPKSYPYVTSWNETVTSNFEYNSAFVDKCWLVSKDKINGIFATTTDATYKVDLTCEPSLGYSLGNIHGLLIPKNSWSTPYNQRITSINLRFNTGGWSTTLKMEEDTDLTSEI